MFCGVCERLFTNVSSNYKKLVGFVLHMNETRRYIKNKQSRIILKNVYSGIAKVQTVSKRKYHNKTVTALGTKVCSSCCKKVVSPDICYYG